ncbi:radical SAM protein [Clostridiaceae bacterium M8S5]|nr:radical SAM protein [Clostridiaceae bacterium M8S5]
MDNLLENRQSRDKITKIRPNKVFLSITNKCSACCLHCFAESGEQLSEELKLNEIYILINQLKDIGITSVSITGGEPFLRNDCIDIIQRLKEKKFKVSIATNGMFLSKEICEKIIFWGMDSISVSLEGIDSVINNKIRKNIDTNRVIENIKSLIKIKKIQGSKIKIAVRTSVNKYNCNHLLEMYCFFSDLGINKYKINNTNLLGNAIRNIDILISEDVFRQKLERLKNYSKQNNCFCKLEFPIEKYILNNNTGKLSMCTSGNKTISISATGDVLPCSLSQEKIIFGNIRLKSLENILNNNLPFTYNEKPCRICKMQNYVNKNAFISEGGGI